MLKPKNYDETAVFGEYQPLPAGGYVCKICDVVETTSQSGKEMIKILLDIAEGDHTGHYAAEYRADTREFRKWGCIVNQLVYAADGNCNRGFKSFVTAVEESNGYTVQWGDNFTASLKGKLVGGMFRREEYVNGQGLHRWRTACYMFRSAAKIREGVEIPEDKPLEATAATVYNEPFSDNKVYHASTADVQPRPGDAALAEFVSLANDEDLPF